MVCHGAPSTDLHGAAPAATGGRRPARARAAAALTCAPCWPGCRICRPCFPPPPPSWASLPAARACWPTRGGARRVRGRATADGLEGRQAGGVERSGVEGSGWESRLPRAGRAALELAKEVVNLISCLGLSLGGRRLRAPSSLALWLCPFSFCVGLGLGGSGSLRRRLVDLFGGLGCRHVYCFRGLATRTPSPSV